MAIKSLAWKNSFSFANLFESPLPFTLGGAVYKILHSLLYTTIRRKLHKFHPVKGFFLTICVILVPVVMSQNDGHENKIYVSAQNLIAVNFIHACDPTLSVSFISSFVNKRIYYIIYNNVEEKNYKKLSCIGNRCWVTVLWGRRANSMNRISWLILSFMSFIKAV